MRLKNHGNLAKNSDYWNAGILNGIATTSILNSDPSLIMKLMEKGALCATISGNGPSIMAITDKKNKSRIQKEFSGLDGKNNGSVISTTKRHMFMNCKIEKSKLSGRIVCPANKSYTHRAIFLAALSDGKSIVKKILRSNDTIATISACRGFGVEV